MPKRVKATGLVEHLRSWGLKVEEVEGWETRGRPYNFLPEAIFVHHDASSDRSGNFGALNVVAFGRPGLNGPLSQFVLGRDGTVKVVAAGYANHAGTGGPRAGIPRNQGNTYAFGIEAANNGIGEPWPDEQLNAYYQLCAALLDWIKVYDVDAVIGHKEWTSRKIDPAGINMNTFRANVKKALAAGKPDDDRLEIFLRSVQPGKNNWHVLRLKKALKKKGFMKNSLMTPYFGNGTKKDYADWQRHLGYKGKDADGRPGRASLEALGFRVR